MPEIVQKDVLEPPRGPWTPESLSEEFPLIPWREPLLVAVAGVEGKVLACRTCVANLGLKAAELAAILGGEDKGRRPTVAAFVEADEFKAHMEAEHPVPVDLTAPPPGALPARGALPPLVPPPGV